MKKLIFRIIIEVLIILGIVALSLNICLDYLLDDGINILGGYARIDIQKRCYIMASGNKQVESQSILTICGLIVPGGEGEDKVRSFTGYANLEQYPVPPEDQYLGTSAQITDKWIQITGQALDLLDSEAETYYNIFILKSDPSVIGLQIFTSDGRIRTAVCAESEEEAIDNCQRFLNALTNNE